MTSRTNAFFVKSAGEIAPHHDFLHRIAEFQDLLTLLSATGAVSQLKFRVVCHCVAEDGEPVVPHAENDIY